MKKTLRSRVAWLRCSAKGDDCAEIQGANDTDYDVRDSDTGRTLRVRSRDEVSDATLVDFAELAPDIDTFLGQAAYLQLGFFETLSELISATPGLADKEALSRAAGAGGDGLAEVEVKVGPAIGP